MTKPLIGPEPVYPTPWRVAEMRNDAEVIVATDGGHQALSADPQLAGLLVTLVNWFAESGLRVEDLKNSQAKNKQGVWIPFENSKAMVW